MSSGAMMSNVGNPQVYNDSDQKTSKQSEDQEGRYEGGQKNAHSLLDSKDARSIGNTLAAAEKAEREDDEREQQRQTAQRDPLKPAEWHGNEPSKGARIDAEIQEEEIEYLQRKGKI